MGRKSRPFLEKLRMFMVLISFFTTQVLCPTFISAQSIFNMPASNTMIFLSESYAPALLKGVKINPNDPLKLDFVMDLGATSFSDKQLNEESTKLIKYFLASLAIPNQDLWVNLSPYEKDKIIPLEFGQTEMGRDLLAQDFILKQITASLMYPENELGKEFWEKVYAKAQAQYGTTDIPLNTFNKVWIIPDKAVVYEKGDTAYIVDSHLKVMLEGDYVALNKGVKDMSAFPETAEKTTEVSDLSASMVREIILPELEKEVNEGKNFVQLRQIYSSLVLATWYKRALKDSLLGKIYIEKKKIDGVQVDDKEIKQKIYNQYLDAFKNGLYNYMKDEYDPVSQTVIPRKYFSGGMLFTQKVDDAVAVTNDAAMINQELKRAVIVSAGLGLNSNADQATLATPISDQLSRQESAFGPLRWSNSRYNFSALSSTNPEFQRVLEEESVGRPGMNARAVNIVMNESGRVVQLGNYDSPLVEQKMKEKKYFGVFITVEGLGDNLRYSFDFNQYNIENIPQDLIRSLIDTLNQLNQARDSKSEPIMFKVRDVDETRTSRPVVLKDVRYRPVNILAKRPQGNLAVTKPDIVDENVKKFSTQKEEIINSMETNSLLGYSAISGYVDEEGRILTFLPQQSDSNNLRRRYEDGEIFMFELRIKVEADSLDLVDISNEKKIDWMEGLDHLVVTINEVNRVMKTTSKSLYELEDSDISTIKPDKLGGIDFNPDQLNIEKRGQGVKFNVNIPEELRNLNADSINGITPIILQIVPITNLPIFLGVNEKQVKAEEVSYL